MKWIRVAARISDDTNVRQIARDAGCSVHEAIGHLVLLWGRMTEQAKDGNLARVHDDDVEAWAEWGGKGCKPGRFAAAVRAALCNEAGVVRAWEKYQGAAIREHEADRKRKSGKNPPDDPPNSGGTPPEIPRNSGGGSNGIPSPTRTSTKTSTTEEILPPPSGDASVREIRPTAAATELPLHVALAVAANQAVTEVWGESPQPYLGTGTQAIALADRIGRAEIPPAFAVRAVFTTCRAFCEAAKSRGDPKRRPGGLSYFGPAVDEAWQQQQAAALAASTPTVTPLPDVKGFATPDPWAAVKRLAEGKVA